MWYWSVCDLGILAGDCCEALVPERHGVDDAVRLGRRGHVLLSGAREVEGVAHDPVAAAPGEDRLLHRHLVLAVGVEPAADLGIFALVILAHDIEIDVAGHAVAQRRLHPGQQPHRAQVDVLVKAAAQRDQQSPQRDVVGHVGVADRAEIDGVVEPQPVEPVLGHHPPGPGIARAAPVEFVPAQFEPVGPRRPLHSSHTLGHDLVPDAVAGDHRDPIALRHVLPPNAFAWSR